MCRITYFVNERERDAVPLAEAMRQAGLDFSSIPTSGPLTLSIDGYVLYGASAIRDALKVMPGLDAIGREYAAL